MCTRSASTSSFAVSSYKSSSTRRPRTTAASGPSSSNRLPRFLMAMPSARSICRKCSSNCPASDASRRGSSGCSTSAATSAPLATSGNGLLRRTGNEATPQRIALGLSDDHVDEPADEPRVAREVDPTVVLRLAGELAHVLHRRLLHQDALHRADHARADRGGLLVEQGLQPLEALLLHLVRQVGK